MAVNTKAIDNGSCKNQLFTGSLYVETIEEINENMPLSIVPKPDNLIRVVMDFKGLSKDIEVKEQKLVSPSRDGYTVVEWGGTEF
jgi:hypothetical protein